MKNEPSILLQAARLSNPWSDAARTPLDSIDAERVADCLRRNKVSLMMVDRLKSNALTARAPFDELLREERELHAKLRDEFLRVKRAFENLGIETLFVKSSGLAPSFPHLFSNLDVLVRRERGDEARKTLHELGYIELTNTEEPNKFLFRRFAGDGFSYTFHLHEAVGWGVPFVDAESIWRNARIAGDDPEVTIPGPGESLLITLAHWFYEDKELSLGNLYHTAAALRERREPLAELARAAAARGWEEGFRCALTIFDESWRRLFGSDALGPEDRAWLETPRGGGALMRHILSRARYGERRPAAIPFLANKLVYYKKILADPARSPVTRMGDVMKTILWAVRWKLHLRSQKPLLIAVSGCDGSGKTVQIEKLAAALDACDLRSKILWARGGSSPFVSFFTRAAKRIRNRGGSSAAAEAEKMQYRSEVLKNPVLRFCYALLYAIDLAWVYAVRVRLAGANGAIVICDRYSTDAMVDFAIMSGGSVLAPPRALALLDAAVPVPDYHALLDVTPAEALERKPEEGGTAHLERARGQFLEIARGRKLEIIDAGRSIAAVHETMVSRSLTMFYERYRTVCNALLYSNPAQINPGRWRP